MTEKSPTGGCQRLNLRSLRRSHQQSLLGNLRRPIRRQRTPGTGKSLEEIRRVAVLAPYSKLEAWLVRNGDTQLWQLSMDSGYGGPTDFRAEMLIKQDKFESL